MPPTKTKTIVLNGEKFELFYIGELAMQLGRQTSTVRKWEIAGTIPSTPFKDKSSRRMYTKEQIDAIVSCAEECHIKQGLSIADTSFKSKVHKALAELNKKYFPTATKK